MTTPTTSRTWIITGASKGLGRALAEAALASGDRVLAAVRDPDAVADLKDTFGDLMASERFDARDTTQAAGLVQAAVDRFGRLDVLVNNAGRAIVGAAEEVTDAQLRDLMDLHLFGTAALVRAALQHRDTIRRQIRELTLSLAATEYKISTYGGTTGDTC